MSSGLSLILFTENEEYLPGITQGYGARLHIHNQDQFPLPSENGVFISSASQTDIGLRLVIYHILNLIRIDLLNITKNEELFFFKQKVHLFSMKCSSFFFKSCIFFLLFFFSIFYLVQFELTGIFSRFFPEYR